MKKLIVMSIVATSVLIGCNSKTEKGKTEETSKEIKSLEEVPKQKQSLESEQSEIEKQEARRLDSLKQVKAHGHAH